MGNDQIIRAHFRKNDPILYSVMADQPLEVIAARPPSEYFISLCRTIIGQQLSTTVADVIFARFEGLFRIHTITPRDILRVSDEALRAIGMSGAKVKFVKDLAQRVHDGRVDLPALTNKPEKEVGDVLTTIKGVGPWTAEMFCMFTLGREDVFSFGDLGLKRAIQELYSLRKEPSRRTMERLSGVWKPYRTYAALALWNFKDR